jgi:hypothetical protein
LHHRCATSSAPPDEVSGEVVLLTIGKLRAGEHDCLQHDVVG